MRVKRSTMKGGTSPPSCTSSKKMTRRSIRSSLRLDGSFGHDESVARVGHHLVALVAVLAFHQDEQHLAAARALLLEDVFGARAHPERVAGVDGFHVLELLLAVEEPSHVELDGARELADLPVLDPHGGLGPPLPDGRAVDLPAHSPISCATISRFQVASPKVTSELLARLK